MSYNKTTWANGDVITAEKLNNIETGVEGANNPLIVNVTWDDEEEKGVADKTFGEIRTALENGQLVYLHNISDDSNGLSVSFHIIYGISYNISEGEFAYGSLESSFQGFSVSVSEAPYTLEALDAEYPYYN